MRFVLAFLLLAVGALFIAKTDGVIGVTGRIGWAERNLGGAGTYTFYKLLGVFLLFLALAFITGIFDRMLGAILGGFLGNVQTNQS